MRGQGDRGGVLQAARRTCHGDRERALGRRAAHAQR